MGANVTRKLIESHLIAGAPEPGEEIGLRIDQTLTQDATGTLVMLELEAMELDRVRTDVSVQYVDHNLLQEDNKNPDDHLFLLSACRRFGVWYSRPGNGVSHPVHQERFGVPGATLLGSDSHTPAAGALGMLAFGAGGMSVALAMAGKAYHVTMPRVRNVRLEGELPRGVSAKDVVLAMLERHGVDGGLGWVFEYSGPGLEHLSAMDRHVIANMGTEMGCSTTVFPADDAVRGFLEDMGRGEAFRGIVADGDAEYDAEETLRLDELEPKIAMPSSPGNVRNVRDVAGEAVHQCYVGSSANPGYRDFAVVAEMLGGTHSHERVSLDLNPASRRILQDLAREGHLIDLLAAGGRLHQTGCNGCIGMGQAPATGRISLRTVPRNFPGRSGTREDSVCLVSPETAAASALTGEITDPRDHAPERVPSEPERPSRWDDALFHAPLPPEEAKSVELVKGPNIVTLPDLEALPEGLDVEVALSAEDDISTDEILPAGAEVLPYRSNIPKIAEFAFRDVSPDYARRAKELRDSGGHAIVGGRNYGQGSSREHAALAPRFLGLRMVLADSFARIHRQNLVVFGVLPLRPADGNARELAEPGDRLVIADVRSALQRGGRIDVRNVTRNERFDAVHDLTDREVEVVAAGGMLDLMKEELR